MRESSRLVCVFASLVACAPGGGPGGSIDAGTADLSGFDAAPGDLPQGPPPPPPLDVAPIDRSSASPDLPGEGIGQYDLGALPDAPRCDGGPVCSARAQGCLGREAPNNGADDNCDGTIDEASVCIPGSVQRCFRGPPGYRGVGGCSDGMQTCQGSGEFGAWGQCTGGISPSAEVCDNLDNDCNGCSDDGLCCTATGTCPAPGDPRIPTGAPFATVTLRGAQFGAGAARYQWNVVGGPCDQMLFDTSRRLTYSLNAMGTAMGGGTQDAEGETLSFRPTLSGDYAVTLVMTFPGGRTLRCRFIVPVRAPGFRAELCWNTSGRDDVDFWLHDPRNTNPWGMNANTDTCAYYNCRNVTLFGMRINWGYADLAGVTCREPDGTACHSPRLDIDNIATAGVPENINVDRPRAGDRFRVAVNYYGGSSMPSPMVNLYCGGSLRSTFGGYDLTGGGHVGGALVPRFTRSGANANGTLWRVADAVMTSSDACNVRALHPAGRPGGYCVDTSTDRSFNGPCAASP